MTLVQKEVQKVYMWKEPYTDYSAMQGPCPDGFHIPTYDEWNGVINAGVSLGAWATNNGQIGVKLRLPLNGNRLYNSGNISNQGSYAYYLCCTTQIASTRADQMYFYSGSTRLSSALKSNAGSIRPFKDEAVIPDSSWFVITQGSGSAGIFRKSSLGFISISSDGTTRYTIADKNLGATTVWNSGDTLSQANCGNYYQRGNNYGFPFTGSITTSSTQVNASTYGPGNYYNSSTFITTSASPYDRSSVQNDNLRGGATGVISGGGDIQIRPTVIPTQITTDMTKSSYTNRASNTSYFYGVKLTALKSGKIKKVGFFTNVVGQLKIANGAYANVAGTTYNISTTSEYELSTPYEITAGQNYFVSIKVSSSNMVYYRYDGTNPFPITGTAVQYNYSNFSGNSTTAQYDRVFQIKSLEIEYTP